MPLLLQTILGIRRATPANAPPRPASRRPRPPASVRARSLAKGFSLLEVLVAMAIFLTGVVAIAGFLPTILRQNQRTTEESVAAYLAQMKAEEIRRDDHFFGGLISEIENMTAESPSTIFAMDPRFAYSFSGETVLYPDLDIADPRRASAVARVIVRYDAAFRPEREILFELRFK